MKLNIKVTVTAPDGRYVSYEDDVAVHMLQEWHANAARAMQIIFSTGACAVYMTSRGQRVIRMIKLLCDATNCELKEGVDLIRDAQLPVCLFVTEDDHAAARFIEEFNSLGGTAEVNSSAGVLGDITDKTLKMVPGTRWSKK